MSTLNIHQFDARRVTNALEKKCNNGKSPRSPKSPKSRNTKYAYKQKKGKKVHIWLTYNSYEGFFGIRENCSGLK